MIFEGKKYVWTAKSKIVKTAPSVVGFTYCFSHLAKGTIVGFEVWHEGKCGRCGAKLTVPESVASGFGPECVKLVNASYQRPSPTPVGAATTADGGSFLDKPEQGKFFYAPKGGESVRSARSRFARDGRKMNGKDAAAAVYGRAKTTQVSDSMDAQIRAKIDQYKAEAPENYYHDGEVDDHEAFRIAYEMFRRELAAL